MNKAIDEILKQYPFIGEDIRREQATLNDYIQRQQEARETLKAANNDGMPHGYDVADKTYEAVEKVIDCYQAKIDEQVSKINDLIDRQKWLDKAYASLTPEERAVVCLLYNEQYSERRVAKIMYQGSRYKLSKVVNEAVLKIKRII
jgi:nicotinate-nucleotide pyrophosphorylase